jgi:hypothetical protein
MGLCVRVQVRLRAYNICLHVLYCMPVLGRTRATWIPAWYGILSVSAFSYFIIGQWDLIYDF